MKWLTATVIFAAFRIFAADLVDWTVYEPKLYNQCVRYVEEKAPIANRTETSRDTSESTTVESGNTTSASTTVDSSSAFTDTSTSLTFTTTAPKPCVEWYKTYDWILFTNEYSTTLCDKIEIRDKDIDQEECERKCLEEEIDCKAYQYSVERFPHCILFSSTSVRYDGNCNTDRQFDWILYEIKSDCRQTNRCSMSEERDKFISGCSYRDYSSRYSTKRTCSAACLNSPRCKAASFKSAGYKPSCILYSDTPETNPNCAVYTITRRARASVFQKQCP